MAESDGPALHSVEIVETMNGCAVTRIRVPGGWLYRHREWASDNSESPAVALAFVPDPPPAVPLPLAPIGPAWALASDPRISRQVAEVRGILEQEAAERKATA